MSETIDPLSGLPSRIYLTGMMGAGKTTLGRQFANQLGYGFIDLDRDIEAYEGRSVQQIFDVYGESYFRDAERKALERTLDHTQVIIATGGGTPCFFDNMEWINRHGVSIYFQATAAFILSRVSRNKGKRPLLKGLNNEELKAFIAKMLAQREPYYMQANHVIGLPVKSVSGIIKSVL